jgi:hypothetical protein
MSLLFAFAALLLLASSAHPGVDRTPDAPITAQTIQAAIDVSDAGDTVVIPASAGAIDFGTARLTLKPGVSLRGAGYRTTIFKSSVDALSITPAATPCTLSAQGQDPLLCVNGATPSVPSIIEGIAFVNEAQSAPPVAGPYPGPTIGISIRAAGERH